MLSTLAFYRAYQEDITVAGGRRIGIRMLQPADKQLLLDGFQYLSMKSRYFRFFAPKRELTSAELCCLTESDGKNRLALGAFELRPTGAEGAVVGVSQFIRLQEVVGAEFSLVVIDDWQCLGIGCRLLERLLMMAATQGIQYFHGHVLTDNQRACRLIRHVCKEATFHVEGSEITITGLLRCPGQAVRVKSLSIKNMRVTHYEFYNNRLRQVLWVMRGALNSLRGRRSNGRFYCASRRCLGAAQRQQQQRHRYTQLEGGR